MRRLLLTSALMSSLVAAPARAQVVTIDPSAIAQLVRQVGVQLQQVAQLAQEVEWTSQTFQSWVHNPSGAAVGLLNQYSMNNPLPVNPSAMLGLINGAGGLNGALGVLSQFANTAYGANHVYTPTDGTWASQQVIANANGIAGAQGIAQQVYAQYSTRYNLVQSLSQQLMASPTPADREYIMGQIQAQQVWAQQAQGQLQAAHLMLIAQQDSRNQQAEEHMLQSLDNQLSQARAAGVIR